MRLSRSSPKSDSSSSAMVSVSGSGVAAGSSPSVGKESTSTTLSFSVGSSALGTRGGIGAFWDAWDFDKLIAIGNPPLEV